VRLSHARRAIDARFDDPNLVSCAGLVPVMALAQRCGLGTLLGDRLAIAAKGGAHAAAKILAVVAGMVCGADSITDLDLLRHGGMGRLFTGVRAPSTLGTFLRLFTFGHVRQLDAVGAGLLIRLAAATPVLPDAGQVVFVDLDDTVRQTYGYAKQGAGRGYTGVNGLNALLAVISTPLSAPLIAATRLRRGASNSARGAARLLADALATARRAGATGLLLVRADSAYYGADIVAACRRAGARFSITARLTPTVIKAISGIDEQAWVPIRYPNAIYDEHEQRWVSDAEVAETTLTAFTGRRRREQVTARLIVRRVRRLNPATAPAGQTGKQGELFAVYRYHPVFTDSAEPMLHAEATHRDHAIVEQVIAELKNGPLAHLPSGVFTANAAWLVCAAIAHNLTRAAGALAGGRHARTRTGTIRSQLIHTPARIAHSAHRQVLHLPRDWPWEPGLDELFRRALHDPLPAAA
jgi:Transposase DDE domain group 1